MTDKRDEHRRRALRRLLQEGDGDLSVRRDDLRWLLDEVGRLQQGNDRLRRQNRRLRLRAGATDGADPLGESIDAADIASPHDSDADSDADADHGSESS